MTRLLIAFLIIVSPPALFSQDFVSQDNVWLIRANWINENGEIVNRLFTCFFLGEESIGGHTYSRLEYIEADTIVTLPYFYRFIRQSGDSIFARHVISDPEILVFAMNAHINDTVRIGEFQEPVVVSSVDSIQVLDGTFRKRLIVDGYGIWTGDYTMHWIEGIGSTSGTFYIPNGTFGGDSLLCFTKNGDLLYSSGSCTPLSVVEPDLDEIHIWPNPTRGRVNISSPGKCITSVSLVNVDGREERIDNSNDCLTTIDVSGVAEGMYILVIRHSNGATTSSSVIKVD